jgi:hypothetical protein
MSVPGLVLFLGVSLSLAILGFHWLALQVEGDQGIVDNLRDLGVSGSVAMGLACGLLTALVIRFQAFKANLPAWRDL